MEGALTAMLNWYRAMTLAPAYDDARVTVPIRVLWGDGDTALESGLAEQALARCDRGEVVHLPEATHWLHHEQPAKVNRLIVEFLQARSEGAPAAD